MILGMKSVIFSQVLYLIILETIIVEVNTECESKIELRAVLLSCPTKDSGCDEDDPLSQVMASEEAQNLQANSKNYQSLKEEKLRDFPNAVKDCKRKLIITLKIKNSGKIPCDDDYIIVDHVFDPVTGGRGRLLTPVVVKLRQEQMIQLYGLQFQKVVNSNPFEEQRKSDKVCSVDGDNPTCGVATYDGKPIPFSEGFCCSYDHELNKKRQLSEVSHGDFLLYRDSKLISQASERFVRDDSFLGESQNLKKTGKYKKEIDELNEPKSDKSKAHKDDSCPIKGLAPDEIPNYLIENDRHIVCGKGNLLNELGKLREEKLKEEVHASDSKPNYSDVNNKKEKKLGNVGFISGIKTKFRSEKEAKEPYYGKAKLVGEGVKDIESKSDCKKKPTGFDNTEADKAAILKNVIEELLLDQQINNGSKVKQVTRGKRENLQEPKVHKKRKKLTLDEKLDKFANLKQIFKHRRKRLLELSHKRFRKADIRSRGAGDCKNSPPPTFPKYESVKFPPPKYFFFHDKRIVNPCTSLTSQSIENSTSCPSASDEMDYENYLSSEQSKYSTLPRENELKKTLDMRNYLKSKNSIVQPYQRVEYDGGNLKKNMRFQEDNCLKLNNRKIKMKGKFNEGMTKDNIKFKGCEINDENISLKNEGKLRLNGVHEAKEKNINSKYKQTGADKMKITCEEKADNELSRSRFEGESSPKHRKQLKLKSAAGANMRDRNKFVLAKSKKKFESDGLLGIRKNKLRTFGERDKELDENKIEDTSYERDTKSRNENRLKVAEENFARKEDISVKAPVSSEKINDNKNVRFNQKGFVEMEPFHGRKKPFAEQRGKKLKYFPETHKEGVDSQPCFHGFGPRKDAENIDFHFEVIRKNPQCGFPRKMNLPSLSDYFPNEMSLPRYYGKTKGYPPETLGFREMGKHFPIISRDYPPSFSHKSSQSRFLPEERNAIPPDVLEIIPPERVPYKQSKRRYQIRDPKPSFQGEMSPFEQNDPRVRQYRNHESYVNKEPDYQAEGHNGELPKVQRTRQNTLINDEGEEKGNCRICEKSQLDSGSESLSSNKKRKKRLATYLLEPVTKFSASDFAGDGKSLRKIQEAQISAKVTRSAYDQAASGENSRRLHDSASSSIALNVYSKSDILSAQSFSPCPRENRTKMNEKKHAFSARKIENNKERLLRSYYGAPDYVIEKIKSRVKGKRQANDLKQDENREKDIAAGEGSQDTAHCMRFGDLWYSLYLIKKPVVAQIVGVQLFEKHTSCAGTVEWRDLTKGKMVRIGTFLSKAEDELPTVSMTYLADKTMKFKGSINPDNYFLLVPNHLSDPSKSSNYPQIDGGPEEYLVVDSNYVSSGANCNMIGTSFEAFARQPDRCSRPMGSCLKRQPVDLWREDMEARIRGKRGKYFVENFGTVPNSPIKTYTNLSGEFLALEYYGDYSSTIEIEVKADFNAMVKKGSNALIPTVYIDGTYPKKTRIILSVLNIGLTSSFFRPRLDDCPPDLDPAWCPLEGPLVTIPPQQRHDFKLDLSGTLPPNKIHVTVQVLNQVSKKVAYRKIVIRKGDRCICAFHCKCTCIRNVDGRTCHKLSIDEYRAAGYVGSFPFRGGAAASTSESIKSNLRVIFLTASYILLLLGLIKGISGIFYRRIGIAGMRVIVGPRLICKYYESELQCCSVHFDECGFPIHPTTCTPVQIVPLWVEVILNFLFFFLYPLRGIWFLILSLPCCTIVYEMCEGCSIHEDGDDEHDSKCSRPLLSNQYHSTNVNYNLTTLKTKPGKADEYQPYLPYKWEDDPLEEDDTEYVLQEMKRYRKKVSML